MGVGGYGAPFTLVRPVIVVIAAVGVVSAVIAAVGAATEPVAVKFTQDTFPENVAALVTDKPPLLVIPFAEIDPLNEVVGAVTLILLPVLFKDGVATDVLAVTVCDETLVAAIPPLNVVKPDVTLIGPPDIPVNEGVATDVLAETVVALNAFAVTNGAVTPMFPPATPVSVGVWTDVVPDRTGAVTLVAAVTTGAVSEVANDNAGFTAKIGC